MPEARSALAELADALERVDYRGWDPYDALSSPLVRRVARGRTLRRAALQACKRSPLNLRPAICVPKAEHAKALALAVSAYSRLGQRDRALPLAERLSRLALRSAETTGWGYAFDVDMRWGSYGATDPNAVVTAYGAHALLDLGGDDAADDVAGAVRLALRSLLAWDGSESYFAYCRGSRVAIHNANLLVASFVGRASELGSPERAAATRAVEFTLARQRRDGSWPYGEGRSIDWVDGFHSAYVLERLAQWNRIEPDPAIDDALARGTAYFIESLVDEDGAPRATNVSRHPVESHAAGSAVTALLQLCEYDERSAATADKVLRYALAWLRRSDGRFVFRRSRFGVNHVPYIRWSDAHMLLALASYVEAGAR